MIVKSNGIDICDLQFLSFIVYDRIEEKILPGSYSHYFQSNASEKCDR